MGRLGQATKWWRGTAGLHFAMAFLRYGRATNVAPARRQQKVKETGPLVLMAHSGHAHQPRLCAVTPRLGFCPSVPARRVQAARRNATDGFSTTNVGGALKARQDCGEEAW